MENLRILLLRLGRSCVHGSMNQRQALCKASWNPIPFSRKGSDTNTKFKSTAKASPSSYATRRPQELRFRGTTPWRSALPGRARSAVRATALLLGCHRKTGASPELHQETKRHSPRRQGFRRDPSVRPSKLRAGADSRGRPKDGTGPLPLLRLCEAADAFTVGPKALHPFQPLECPTPRVDTGTKGSLPGAGCPQSPLARAQNARGRGAAARRVRTETRATLTGAEPPERRGAGGRFLWGPARVQSDPNFSRPQSPAAAGARAQPKGAASRPRRQCPLGPRRGRERRPYGLPAGAGPHLPLSAGYRQRLPRRRQLSLQPLGLLPPPPARERVAA